MATTGDTAEVEADEDREARRLIGPILLLGGLALLATSLTSLVGAYVWMSSPIWVAVFAKSDDPSVAILKEFARALIFLALTTFLFYRWFPRETAQLVDPRRHSLRSNTFRLVFILIVVVVGYREITRHVDLSKGPTDVALKWVEQEKKRLEQQGERPLDADAQRKLVEETAHRVRPAYLAYLPYSLINYFFIGAPLIVLTFYAFFVELPDLKKSREAVERSAIGFAGPAELELKKFTAFQEECRSRADRYLNVHAIVAFHILYESAIGGSDLFGAPTLTDAAWRSLYCFWAFVLLTIVCPIYVVMSYYEASEVVRKELVGQHQLPEDFDQRFGTGALTDKMASSSPIGAVFRFVLGIFRFAK